MKLKHILLALLARRAQSGYDMWRWLVQEGRFFRANSDRSQIYRTLGQMTNDGWIAFETQESEAGPDAKVYTLTTAGIAELRRVIESPYVPPKRMQEPDFGVRFFLTGALDPMALLRLIDTEIEARQAQIKRYRTRDRSILTGPGGLPMDQEFAQRLADDLHHHGERNMDDWLAWLHAERVRVQSYLDRQTLTDAG